MFWDSRAHKHSSNETEPKILDSKDRPRSKSSHNNIARIYSYSSYHRLVMDHYNTRILPAKTFENSTIVWCYWNIFPGRRHLLNRRLLSNILTFGRYRNVLSVESKYRPCTRYTGHYSRIEEEYSKIGRFDCGRNWAGKRTAEGAESANWATAVAELVFVS